MERDIIWNEFFTTTIMWPFDFCFNGVFVPLEYFSLIWELHHCLTARRQAI